MIFSSMMNKELIRMADESGDELAKELADRIERCQHELNESEAEDIYQSGYDEGFTDGREDKAWYISQILDSDQSDKSKLKKIAGVV